jgi:hypothetical protein
MKSPALKPNPEHLPFLNALRAKLGRPLYSEPPAPPLKPEPTLQLNLADYIRQRRHAKA